MAEASLTLTYWPTPIVATMSLGSTNLAQAPLHLLGPTLTLAAPRSAPARWPSAMAEPPVQSPATSRTMTPSLSTGPIALRIAAVFPAQEA